MLYQEVGEAKRQLLGMVTPEKEMDPESGYESTGSLATVTNKKRSYAEAARYKWKGKDKEKGRPTAERPLPAQPQPRVVKAKAVVMHAAPLRYKQGTMRTWFEEHNTMAEIMAIRWLTREHVPGKVAFSFVTYMRYEVQIGKLKMGGKHFHSTRYGSDRDAESRKIFYVGRGN